MEITIRFSERDLDQFHQIMRDVMERTGSLDEAEIIDNARTMLRDVKGADSPAFIRERLDRLQALIAMVVDEDWALDQEDRQRVLQALSYFSEPSDLIPDDVPGLGLLDDAIMLEIVSQELHHELHAYDDFCACREDPAGHLQDTAEPTERTQWLEEQRKQLHARMRDRRSKRGGKRHKSPFSLF